MIQLHEIPTRAPKGLEKEDIKRKTDRLTRRIGELQHIMYAEKKQNFLVVFQGMDASGKDGATRKVFSYCNPTGILAYPFRKPTEEEFAHDFLWRIHKQTPAKGQIKIFIRSHYEDILIQRVHEWINDDRALMRLEAINNFEKLLQEDNQTTILKFYLHISHERQIEKLDERKTTPGKQWKFNPADYDESKLWDKYMRYYEAAINGSDIPWIIVPADHRWYRDYIVAKKVYETLSNLNPEYPLIESQS